jgi:glycosyltransferase involved in cell wall biosynthesis
MRPRSPYAVSKLAGYWTPRVYREAYDTFVACGILFNHENEVRGPEFVTRKIAMEVARTARELGSDPRSVPRPLLLGSLDARKDWGYAPDYVDAMWRMLQIDRPEDFVIGTGEQHAVREFASEAFRAAGIEISWRTGAGRAGGGRRQRWEGAREGRPLAVPPTYDQYRGEEIIYEELMRRRAMTIVDEVAVFVPGYYDSTLYSLNLIPADRVTVYYPEMPAKGYNDIVKKRMNAVERYPKIELIPLKPNIASFDIIYLIKKNYSLNSFYTFDESDLKRVSAGIIFVVEAHTLYSYQIAKYAYKYNKKLVILTEYDPQLTVNRIPPYSIFNKYVFRSASAVAASTQLSYINTRKYFYREDKILRAHHSSPQLPSDVKDKSFDEFNLLFVGTLDHHKGFHTLVRALNALADKLDFRITIVGQGPLEGALASAKFRYEHHAFLEKNALYKIYANSNIYIQPSETQRTLGLVTWTEVFGLSFLDAMGYGLATISSNCGNLPYLNQDKLAIFEMGNYNDLYNKLYSLMLDEERLKADSRLNRRFAVREFSPKALESKWRNVLEAVSD